MKLDKSVVELLKAQGYRTCKWLATVELHIDGSNGVTGGGAEEAGGGGEVSPPPTAGRRAGGSDVVVVVAGRGGEEGQMGQKEIREMDTPEAALRVATVMPAI